MTKFCWDRVTKLAASVTFRNRPGAMDDAVPTQAMDQVAARAGDEPELVGHAVPNPEAKEVAFEQGRQRVRRLLDRPFLKAPPLVFGQ